MKEDKLNKLYQATLNYSPQEKENFEIDYLERIIFKAPELEKTTDSELFQKIDLILDTLPIKEIGKRLKYNSQLLEQISNLKSFVKEKYNLLPKGYYRKKYFGLGLAIGPSIGLFIGAFMGKGKIAIGLPLGIPIGMTIGLIMGKQRDEKTEKENRVI